MSSDHDKAADHSDGHGDSHGGHDAHDDHAPAADVIPESSLQDMLLKGVTIAGAVLIIGTGFWWSFSVPLPEGGEGHGGHAEGGAVETHEH